jgi:hypothetical protein
MSDEGGTTSTPRSAFCVLHSAFLRHLVTITATLWAAAFFGCCARTLFLKVDKSSVYPDFSTAGKNWVDGEPLYVRGGTHEFRYSPLVAAFFVPFELLPNRIGEFFWRSLNFAAFIGGLWYCCKTHIPKMLSTRETCAVFLLCIPLAIGSLNNAQSNPLVLGLMLISIAAAARKNWTMCAVAITLATCFKLYPIALGLLLVLMFPRKMGWRLLVALAAAAVLPFLMQRAAYVMDQYAVWVHYLSSEDRQRGPITDWYRDFRALWRVYVATMSQRTYLIIELAGGAVVALVVLIARLRKIPLPLLLAFTLSLACCWMTALGPATESATYVLLAPAVAWGLVLGESDKSKVRRIAYGCVFALFLASQLAINIHGGKWFRDHLQPLPLAGTFLLLIVLGEAVLRAVEGSSLGVSEAPMTA